MSDLVQLVQEADFALMDIEQTRIAIEAARVAYEMAKNDHDRAKAALDEVISRADEVGIPRIKLRKLAEERAAVLMASGLMSVPVNKMRGQLKSKGAPKAAKSPGKGKGKKSEADLDGADSAPAQLNS